ncbi:hypothetical protein BD779DRAFT_1474720 [Infundibulicybe gibba]|nr:hypothetical protein BD779DRAFT_1474720 [Infundibulicybe gibba]
MASTHGRADDYRAPRSWSPSLLHTPVKVIVIHGRQSVPTEDFNSFSSIPLPILILFYPIPTSMISMPGRSDNGVEDADRGSAEAGNAPFASEYPSVPGHWDGDESKARSIFPISSSFPEGAGRNVERIERERGEIEDTGSPERRRTMEGTEGRVLVVCFDGTSNQFGENMNAAELYRRIIKDAHGPSS